MKMITIFDTSSGSGNIGDSIIMESVERELNEIITDYSIFQFKVPTHSRITPEQRESIKKSKLKIVCGTNLFRMRYRPFKLTSNPWKIRVTDIKDLNNTLFFGVGTTILPKKDDIIHKTAYKLAEKYSGYLWNKILNKEIPHSVRDQETCEMLKRIGIKNVINTGCPTLWNLDENHCKNIPTKKGKNVILTITGKATENIYLKYLEIAMKNYEKVFMWPQSIVDIPYMEKVKNLFGNKVEILAATLKAYDEVLENEESLDYIGSRLHGGIRALQHKRRSIIIAIDSRARSFRNDFNLPVIDNKNLSDLDTMINSEFRTEIKLKSDRIEEFKSALKEYLNTL